MGIDQKAETTRTIWKFLIGGMVLLALFLSELGALLIPIYAFMLIAASVTTHSIWNGMTPDSKMEREKAKRERLDTVLRHLSTQELQILRDRLSQGDFDDNDIYAMLGDDGELYLEQSG